MIAVEVSHSRAFDVAFDVYYAGQWNEIVVGSVVRSVDVD